MGFKRRENVYLISHLRYVKAEDENRKTAKPYSFLYPHYIKHMLRHGYSMLYYICPSQEGHQTPKQL